MAKIFVSYAHVDKENLVEPLVVNILRAGGHDVWYDWHLTPGQAWQDELLSSIKRCDVFVYALTPESAKSEYCLWEFEQAIKHSKSVVPVLLRKTELPTALTAVQYVDFTKGAQGIDVARLMRGIHKASDFEITSERLSPVIPPKNVTYSKNELDANENTQVPLVVDKAEPKSTEYSSWLWLLLLLILVAACSVIIAFLPKLPVASPDILTREVTLTWIAQATSSSVEFSIAQTTNSASATSIASTTDSSQPLPSEITDTPRPMTAPTNTVENEMGNDDDAPLTPITGTLCDSSESRLMWAELNEFRRQNNMLPLAFSPILCEVAQQHVYDLLSRPTNQLGNLYIRNDDVTNYLDVWLEEAGYQSYAGNYIAAIRPFVAQDVPPEPTSYYPGFIQYLFNHETDEDIYNFTLAIDYREIGISYFQTASLYYYVFIFGSQPNLLPLVPVDPEYTASVNQSYTYAYEWSYPQIGLLIHNERYSPIGTPPNRIGTVVYIRTALHEIDIVECPEPDSPLTNGWIRMPVTTISPYQVQLSGSLGLETIYVQMCDGNRTSTINSVTINYTGE